MKLVRDESTPEGKAIWQMVEKAAARCMEIAEDESKRWYGEQGSVAALIIRDAIKREFIP